MHSNHDGSTIGTNMYRFETVDTAGKAV